jgi:hypothetical protein
MSATTARCRRWAALLVFLGVATAGCNPITMPYFLLYGFDNGVPAEKPIANDKKEVKVLILTTGASEWRPMELVGADRELTGLVARHLSDQCKENKERVSIVSGARWQRFKDEHPNWKSLSSEEIGKYFEADYVLDLEIGALTLFEPGSMNQFYRGHAEISISMLDMSKHGDESPFHKEYECDFPRTRGPVPISDTNPQKFRDEFLNRVARDIAWLFTSHPVEDHFMD